VRRAGRRTKGGVFGQEASQPYTFGVRCLCDAQSMKPERIALKLSKKLRRTVYDSTGGECHLCHCKVAFKNYGKHGERGAWEVDHSMPVSKGGTNRVPNLRPACTSCNREKQDMTTRAIRARNGVTGLPPSREERRTWAVVKGLLGAGAVVVLLVVGLVAWGKSGEA
jgi:hypothetical protein